MHKVDTQVSQDAVHVT